MRFKDRRQAGQLLADVLSKYRDEQPIVYALPRGGVILGYEIAKKLNAPLDIVITRKIGHPLQPEYAVCAVAEDGHLLCNENERVALDESWLNQATIKERQEAIRRRSVYLNGRQPISAAGKTAIIVDDGIATGLTIQLAISEIKHLKPRKIVLAVPVVSSDIAEKLKQEVDEMVVLEMPFLFMGAVGAYYEDFGQVTDEEVIKLLSAE